MVPMPVQMILAATLMIIAAYAQLPHSLPYERPAGNGFAGDA